MRGIHSAVHRSFHGRNRRAAAAAGGDIWHRITQQFPQQIFLVGTRKFQAALFPGTSRRDRSEVRLVPVQLCVVVGISPPLDGIQYGGVHQRRYPNSLMVNGKSKNKMDDFGVPPILGNSHVSSRMRNITRHGHMTHDPHP